MLAVVVAGCGKEKEENNDTDVTTTPVEQQNQQDSSKEDTAGTNETGKVTEPKGYVFEYNGVKVGMDMEAAPIIAALGDGYTYFEAPSCAFEGLDKNYNYGSFEIDTYEQNGKDYIAGVFFCDDLIETPEGVCLFETKADMTAAYGEGYKEEKGLLVYEKEGMKLKFILEGDEITSIEYTSNALEVEQQYKITKQRIFLAGLTLYIVVSDLLFGKSAVKINVILCLFTIAFMVWIRYNYIGRKLFFVKAFTKSRSCY